MLSPESYGIIQAFLAGTREYPRGDKDNETKESKMGNEEMIAELKAQILVKEMRVRQLANSAGAIPLTGENLPALECWAVELRSLAYQIRHLMVAKAAALAAR